MSITEIPFNSLLQSSIQQYKLVRNMCLQNLFISCNFDSNDCAGQTLFEECQLRIKEIDNDLSFEFDLFRNVLSDLVYENLVDCYNNGLYILTYAGRQAVINEN